MRDREKSRSNADRSSCLAIWSRREKNAEKELKTVCSKEIKPPATINFFPISVVFFFSLSRTIRLLLVLFVSRVIHKSQWFLFSVYIDGFFCWCSSAITRLVLFSFTVANFMFNNPFCRAHAEFVIIFSLFFTILLCVWLEP